jgi:hypothetical protein
MHIDYILDILVLIDKHLDSLMIISQEYNQTEILYQQDENLQVNCLMIFHENLISILRVD